MATILHEPTRIEHGHLPDNSGGGGFGNLITAGADLRGVEDRRMAPAQTGILVALGAITMSFAALTSALVVRQGTGLDWQHITLPRIVYLNALMLVASSISLEFARRHVAYVRGVESQIAAAMRWLLITLALGLFFIAGQCVSWLRLRAQGLYLATNPNSSFFYVFTGVHAAHVLGGIAGLAYAINRLKHSVLRRSTFAAVSQYWHFMDILWLYLLFVLWLKL